MSKAKPTRTNTAASTTTTTTLRVGVTGHRRLGDDPRTPLRVHAQIVEVLQALRVVARYQGKSVVAHSALAIGADQIFARAALGLGCSLIGVIPFANYREDFAEGLERDEYETLLGLCDEVVTRPFKNRSDEAYLRCGTYLAGQVDYLVAVWDGQPARGKGGTADVVAFARKRGTTVLVVDPQITEQ